MEQFGESDPDISEHVNFRLPAWLTDMMAAGVEPMPEIQERMQWVIGLSALNVRQGTGGPFAAAVFDLNTGQVVAAGVNMVTLSNRSIAHAEIVAITLAQQAVGSFDLGAGGVGAYELVSSTEPCAMCFGATLWSGVRALVYGARGADAAAIGFDEGPKPVDWTGELERRGIRVEAELCRDQARQVLAEYRRQNGLIYNARQG